ncbi:MAG: mechanosensitive ion channel [Saprospiraceae bacterium]|nr:mechanosensitive ion channel [Pyrinomonadaceae bacterium]
MDFAIIAMQNANTGTRIVDNAEQIKNVAWQSINNLITSIIAQFPYIIAGIIVLILFWILSKLVKKAFIAATRRTKLDKRLRILISRMIVVAFVTIGVFTALTVIIPSFDFATLIGGIGFTSLAVGFAAKDILNNFVSGVLILWQRPFHIGDQIFVGNNSGKVEYIGVRATSLRKDDGELILIPNGDMYSSPLTIRGAGAKRRMNLKYSLGYEGRVEEAKALTFDALSQTEGVVLDPKPRVLVSNLTSDGVIVTVNFWINTNESKPLEVFDRAAIGIVRALGEAEIEMFPPGSMIVQRPDEEIAQEEGMKKDSDT